MSKARFLVLAALMTTSALAGCFGGGEQQQGPEPDPSTFSGEIYDRAIGNKGFRVASDVTAAGTELGSGSAAQLDVVDVVTADSEGAMDKATFILDAREPNLNVVARLRQMAGGDSLGTMVPHLAGDLRGGVGHYVQVFGTTGLGPATLPESTAFLFASGMAQVKMGDATLPDNYPVFAVVTQGFHDETGAIEAAADTADLEFHVFIAATEDQELPGIAEGFLYYYFETVGMDQLDADLKATVGADLVEPEAPNAPPVAVARVLVGGAPAWNATKEGDENLTVTFDASLSSDADGEIVVYVWRILELNQTGNLSKPTEGEPLASGQTVDYNFTAAGPKTVELIVRDDRGAIHNNTIQFYVDQHRVYESPEGNNHLATVSGGESCRRDLNCFQHYASIGHGAQSATFTLTNTGQMQSPRLELYEPNVSTDEGEPVAEASGRTLTVAAEAIQTQGRYTVQVWWSAGATITYKIDATTIYTPAELPPLPTGDAAAEGESGEGEGDDAEPTETPEPSPTG